MLEECLGKVLFDETVNERYARLVLTFFDQVFEDRGMYGYFIQVSDTACTANNSVNVLAELLVKK
jgi:hypothetical protein